MDQEIHLGKRSVAIYSFTGKVVNSSKNLETKISGGGGGGHSYQGTGQSAPIHIKSTTVVHDQLFLVDQSGNERSFQLQDFNLACRESNIVSVLWGVVEGQESGSYFAIINHTTGKEYKKDSVIKDFVYQCTLPFYNPLLGCLTLIAGIIFLGFIWWPLAVLAIGGLAYYELVIVKNKVKFFNSTLKLPIVKPW